jgi:hypothetical protein
MDRSQLGDFTLGDFTIIDLIAATTNAFNGAILAREPSHYRKFTVVGILLIAVLAGSGAASHVTCSSRTSRRPCLIRFT